MKKNLIYIFADQWRAHAIGEAKQDAVHTPNMDSFAKESFHFTNAVSTYPLCSPHRASLLTGKYPFCCGMWTNCKIGLDEIVMLKPQEITIGDVLHQENYQTAYIGKWHLDASEQNFYSHPQSGAKNWDAYTPPGERRHHFDYWYSYGAMDDHISPHYWMDSSKMIRGKKWSVEQETDVALSYLQNRDKDRPFCMFLSWNPPHPPYDQVPQEYIDLYRDAELSFRENVPSHFIEQEEFQRKMRQYFAAISGLDENFGRIINYLKEEELYENTILVLSSDHGDCMGSHGLYGKNVWYEESIRIPLYIGGADLPNGKSDVLFASPDHMPTLLELLDVPIPDTVQGNSFAKCFTDSSIKGPETAFLCMMPGMPEMVNAYRDHGLNSKCFGWRGLRTREHTYVVDNGTSPEAIQKRYLYHNDSDPYQLHPKQLTSDQAHEWDQKLSDYLRLLNDPFLL